MQDVSLQDANWCVNTFGALLEDPSTHDVVFITSDGGSVSAHWAIIAAGSPMFYVMLYSNMVENNEKEIIVPTVDSVTLRGIFLFIYTGKVDISSKCIIKMFS